MSTTACRNNETSDRRHFKVRSNGHTVLQTGSHMCHQQERRDSNKNPADFVDSAGTEPLLEGERWVGPVLAAVSDAKNHERAQPAAGRKPSSKQV